MALSIAMILVRGEHGITPAAVQASFARLWSNVPPLTGVESDDATLSFEIGGSSVILGYMPAPIPASELEGPCATSRLWKDATTVVPRHTSHVIVTVQHADDVDPIERSELLSIVTAAVLDASPTAIGVYWGAATLVIPRDFFLDSVLEVLPEEPPIDLWVDYRVAPNGKRSRGFTQGLAALGFAELETDHATESPNELFDRLQTVSRYLLEHGPVIEHGHTLGKSEDEKILVQFGPSAIGLPGTVMHLVYDEPPPKKGWWPFGRS